MPEKCPFERRSLVKKNFRITVIILDDPAHGWSSVCPRSGYWEKLVIPQLLELVNDYQLDGFWIDGDLWGFPGCRCEKCTGVFSLRTGIAEIPEKPGDPRICAPQFSAGDPPFSGQRSQCLLYASTAQCKCSSEAIFP